VIRALADPSLAASWARADGTYFAPHSGFDLDVYADPVDRALASVMRAAIESETFRFDASDQLPAPVTDVLHSALVSYVTDPDASAEEALAAVEEAWIEYEATSRAG
jgi:alpha-glucoside transport system substrate-binding protein